MVRVFTQSWALLLGLLLIMVGNGMQGTLIGIRGESEGFDTFMLSLIISAYFLGFLGGGRLAPELIRHVGHIRVFAAVASISSAVLILFPTLVAPWLWLIGRVIIGFCFSVLYVVVESWLNDAADNENRGQALSLYMIIQTAGIVSGQALLLVADVDGFILFILASVLVSISVAPSLLSASPVPAFETTQSMSLKRLFDLSPLGCVGMALIGGIYAALFGMASIYGRQVGLSVAEISVFLTVYFVGALIFQYPVGWLADRMERRKLIALGALAGLAGALLAAMAEGNYQLILLAMVILGAVGMPLHSLLLAHANDNLDHSDMAAASGGLVFVNALGAIGGPILVGAVMQTFGPDALFVFAAGLYLMMMCYAIYRRTQSEAIPSEETGSYVALYPAASPVAAEIAQEYVIETELQEQEDQEQQENDAA